MNRLKSLLSLLLYVFMYISIAWFQFGGIYHCATKHNNTDLMLAIFIPPVAWYRSIEFFWHNDGPKVNWEVAIKDDFNVAIRLYNDDVHEITNVENSKEKYVLRNEISKLPESQKYELKSALADYANYSILASKNLENSAIKYNDINYTAEPETYQMLNLRYRFGRYLTKAEADIIHESAIESMNFVRQSRSQMNDSNAIIAYQRQLHTLHKLYEEKSLNFISFLFGK